MKSLIALFAAGLVAAAIALTLDSPVLVLLSVALLGAVSIGLLAHGYRTAQQGNFVMPMALVLAAGLGGGAPPSKPAHRRLAVAYGCVRQNPRVVPNEVLTYGRSIVASLREALGDEFLGAYFVGSIALSGYVPGESDIDIVAVSEQAIPDQLKRSLAEAVFDTTMSCPARGLEFTLYRRAVAQSSPVAAGFEINVNGGSRMARDIHLEARNEPGFWYVIDRAIAQKCGVAICGPPPADMFAQVSRGTLLDAMIESMRWHREHEKATLYSVLNATRAWRFAADNSMVSKLEGAAWARERWSSARVIDAAVDLRHGRPATLDAAEVDALLDHVERTLANAK